MSEEEQKPRRRPIEVTYPIEQVNEIANRESHAKRYYRPVYTMHKWWARRLGSVFRSLLLYSLADEELSVRGERQSEIGTDGLPELNWENPEALWDYYLEDVDLGDKTILDPFMGGGTSIVEALRMGVDAVGSELNPVAWFIVKKEVEQVSLESLDTAFDNVQEAVGQDIQGYYRTECPECDDHHADSMYHFWVNLLPCRNCGEDVPLMKDYALAKARSSKDSYYNVVCPECWNVFAGESRTDSCECPKCKEEFVPSKAGHVSRGKYTCPHCDERPTMSIVESIERFDKPDKKLYAVEYYCEHADTKGYKSAQQFDRELYRDAESELENCREDLSIPTQNRYKGSSDRARNHGYETYDQMFNSRQLLCLGKLLDEIQSIEDQNVKEFLLLTFSDSLTFNNMFCEYHKTANKIQGIYKRHTITARNAPVENNIWGTKYGAGTFTTEFNKMRAGKEYCQDPWEKYVEDGETKQRDGVGKIEGTLVDDPADLGSKGNVHLRCGTSEYLPLDDGTVDAVITDPPYFDNVMYAETADFYYVWLKQVLEDEYEHFTAELTPKASEIVSDPAKNVETHRDEEHFITGLTNVFSESKRVLRDDGVMAFTFHHKETEGWSSVLKSVLDGGFYVTAIYPVRGEMRGSTHIHGKANIEYDMIVVCRKRTEEPDEVSWRSLEDDIYFRASEEIERLEESGSSLAQGDIFAVTMGKCLEVYSQHYPTVTQDGDSMSVERAIETIRDIVDEQLMAERVQVMSDEMDPLSAVYIAYVLGRGDEIPFGTLNKELQQRGVDVTELISEHLVERDGNQLEVLSPLKRAEAIEGKRDPLAIDRAHYLYILYQRDRLAQEFGQWSDEESITTLRRLAKVENDDDYEDIADYVAERTGTQLDIQDFF